MQLRTCLSDRICNSALLLCLPGSSAAANGSWGQCIDTTWQRWCDATAWCAHCASTLATSPSTARERQWPNPHDPGATCFFRCSQRFQLLACGAFGVGMSRTDQLPASRALVGTSSSSPEREQKSSAISPGPWRFHLTAHQGWTHASRCSASGGV